jgi:hypothetical protein
MCRPWAARSAGSRPAARNAGATAARAPSLRLRPVCGGVRGFGRRHRRVSRAVAAAVGQRRPRLRRRRPRRRLGRCGDHRGGGHVRIPAFSAARRGRPPVGLASARVSIRQGAPSRD